MHFLVAKSKSVSISRTNGTPVPALPRKLLGPTLVCVTPSPRLSKTFQIKDTFPVKIAVQGLLKGNFGEHAGLETRQTAFNLQDILISRVT